MSDLKLHSDHLPIYKLEQGLRSLPALDLPVGHAFCKGLYARTLFIPAGTVLTSAVHKDQCFFLVRTGSILITTDNGPEQVDAGFMSITEPGTKRAGFAITDTVVTTFHANPTELREPEELWNHYTEPAPDGLVDALKRDTLEVL